MILTLDAKCRLTLPATLVPAQPGDHFQAEFDPEEDAVSPIRAIEYCHGKTGDAYGRATGIFHFDAPDMAIWEYRHR